MKWILCLAATLGMAAENPPSPAEAREHPPVDHPLVRTHPETGRKALYLGNHASHILGMPEAKGRALLHALLEHTTLLCVLALLVITVANLRRSAQFTVREGDTLSAIALQFYGDGTEPFWRTIYNANIAVIGPDPDAIRSGQQLRIPT